jgi:uncharacterized protein YkwD
MRHKLIIAGLLAALLAGSCKGGDGPVLPGPGGDNSISGMLRRHNEARVGAGAAALSENSLLNQIAQDQAEHMADISDLTHTDADGGLVTDRADAAGYVWVLIGENVGYASSGQTVFSLWMDSPGHKANILNTDFTEIGLGKASSGLSTYWCAVYGDL